MVSVAVLGIMLSNIDNDIDKMEFKRSSIREYWCIFVFNFVSFLYAAIINWCLCLNSPS